VMSASVSFPQNPGHRSSSCIAGRDSASFSADFRIRSARRQAGRTRQPLEMSRERIIFQSMKHVLFSMGLAVTVASAARAVPAARAQPARPGCPAPAQCLVRRVFENLAERRRHRGLPRGNRLGSRDSRKGLEFFLQRPDGEPAPRPAEYRLRIHLPAASRHILTNFHVIEGAQKIVVKLKDGRKFDAEVKGGDERSDLAVIKIEGGDLPVAELGDSDAVKVGEFAFAIGTRWTCPTRSRSVS